MTGSACWLVLVLVSCAVGVRKHLLQGTSLLAVVDRSGGA